MIILNLNDFILPSLITAVPLTVRNLKWKYLLNANYGPKVGSIHKMVQLKLIWDSSKCISEERSAIKPLQIVSFPHAKVWPNRLYYFMIYIASPGDTRNKLRNVVLIPHLWLLTLAWDVTVRLTDPPASGLFTLPTANSQAMGSLPLNSTHSSYHSTGNLSWAGFLIPQILILL